MTTKQVAGSTKQTLTRGRILAEDPRFDLTAWVVATVKFLDPFAGDMRVYLGGG